MNNKILSRAVAHEYYNTKRISEILDNIVSNIEIRDSRIKYLEEENKKLKDEAFKDEELKMMQEKLKQTSDALMNSFQISKKRMG